MKRHTKNKIKELGMVFTPDYLVNDMLDKLPESVFKENKTFLDNSCGDGAFLIEVLRRKMINGFSHRDALSSIFGVELDYDNFIKCKTRLLLNSKDPELIKIVDDNIVNADALDPEHPGWNHIGFYWSNIK